MTVRRDLAKQQTVGQQRERDRQAKYKSNFFTLIEDGILRRGGVESIDALKLLGAVSGLTRAAASLTVRRDLAKQQIVGQQRERDRRAKFKSIFFTLIEELRRGGVESIDALKLLGVVGGLSQRMKRNSK